MKILTFPSLGLHDGKKYVFDAGSSYLHVRICDTTIISKHFAQKYLWQKRLKKLLVTHYSISGWLSREFGTLTQLGLQLKPQWSFWNELSWKL